MTAPLGEPLTIGEVSAELRDKARRLRAEMGVPEVGAPSVHILLAWALIDAVNDGFAVYLETESPQRPIYERAIELAKQHNTVPIDESMARFMTWGSPGQRPTVVMVKVRDANGAYVEEPVVALQALFADMKPLWVQYFGEAKRQVEDEAQAQADKEKAV